MAMGAGARPTALLRLSQGVRRKYGATGAQEAWAAEQEGAVAKVHAAGSRPHSITPE